MEKHKRSLGSKIAWGALIVGAGLTIATVVGFLAAPTDTYQLIVRIAENVAPESGKSFVESVLGKMPVDQLNALEKGYEVVSEKGVDVIKGVGNGSTAQAVTDAATKVDSVKAVAKGAQEAFTQATQMSNAAAITGNPFEIGIANAVTAVAKDGADKAAVEVVKATGELTKNIDANSLATLTAKAAQAQAGNTGIENFIDQVWRPDAVKVLSDRNNEIKAATKAAIDNSTGIVKFITHNRVITGIGAALATIGLVNASDRRKEEDKEGEYKSLQHEANETFAMKEDMRKMQTVMALRAAAAGHPGAQEFLAQQQGGRV